MCLRSRQCSSGSPPSQMNDQHPKRFLRRCRISQWSWLTRKIPEISLDPFGVKLSRMCYVKKLHEARIWLTASQLQEEFQTRRESRKLSPHSAVSSLFQRTKRLPVLVHRSSGSCRSCMARRSAWRHRAPDQTWPPDYTRLHTTHRKKPKKTPRSWFLHHSEKKHLPLSSW